MLLLHPAAAALRVLPPVRSLLQLLCCLPVPLLNKRKGWLLLLRLYPLKESPAKRKRCSGAMLQ
jgi:hypothetical protein